MTTKQAQHLVPGDRVQTLYNEYAVESVTVLPSGTVHYTLRGNGVFQSIVSMPEWKVELV